MAKIRDMEPTAAITNSKNITQNNAKVLEAELQWLSRVIDARFKQYFGEETDLVIQDIKAPALKKIGTSYAKWVSQQQLSFAERLCLVLALTPHPVLSLIHI